MLGLVQLKGGRGGIRVALGPNADPDRVGGEIVAALQSAAQFLGSTKITVEVADDSISPALAAAIAGAFANFPRLSLAGIGVPKAAPSRKGDHEPKVLRQTIRSGQEVMHSGDLVVLGDVHVGGRVVATGDVIVVGALRGFAWAGADGDETTIIYAQPLHPTQVRIGGVIAQGGDAPEAVAAEYAHIEGGRIVVEPWSSGARQGARRTRVPR
ncbi:MAG: hypothetical protein M0Z66_02690 [Thermaerobacter sp.]|nr:hypothetical protein [Thermaerobacter sp.]